MSTPLRYITLTGTLTRGAGPERAVGYVQVAALKTTEAPDADVLVTNQPSSPVRLVDGHFEIPVVVSGDPSLLEPVLVELRVMLDQTRPDVRVYNIATDGDTLDIADAILVPQVPNEGEYTAVVPWSAVGRSSGVAPLGQDGRVPASFLPPASGGVSAYHHEQNTAVDTWEVQHNLGYRPAFSFQDGLGRAIGAGWQLEHALDLMTTFVHWPTELSGAADCS